MALPSSHSDDQATHDRLASPLLAEVLAKQRVLWQRGEHVLVEHLLVEAAALLDQPAAILDLIYNEMILREEHGEQPRLEEYVRRFPHLAHELELQFRIDPGIEVLPAPHRVQRQLPQPVGVPLPPLPTTWSLTGYEILGELGRGGMGVVYKARQLGLNRLVALKMVLATAASEPQRLERFRTEAEAAARLQHPNIVQVYEIGEQGGWLFFSLELVEGGSLADRIGSGPQPPRAAAELIETLARAMHVVHQRGIVHRDLKPANVLLTADGTPKITDFGLAKLLDSDSNRTRTGTSLGTPRYMAPEQADPGVTVITPAADVYALGTILYEMLTGRPPFSGATPLDTLEQVRTQEPVPPRRLQPKVPRDLETICLKCLRKEPQQRYASAQDLADDLRHFLDGTPIRARPVPVWQRARAWSRRQPTLAVALTAAVLLLVAGLAGTAWHETALRHEKEERRVDFARALDALDRQVLVTGQADFTQAPQLEAQRKQWLQSALSYYHDFLSQRRSDPALAAEAGAVTCRLAEIEALLGDVDTATTSYEQAISLLKPATQMHAPRDQDLRDLGRSYQGLGKVLKEQNRFGEAEAAYRQAQALRERLVRDHPDQPGYQRELADTHYFMGACMAPQEGKTAAAEQAYEQALAAQRQLSEAHPDRPEYRRDLARTLNNLGILLRGGGREKAERCFREAVALQNRLIEEEPSAPELRREAARTYTNLGVCLEEAAANPSTGESIPKEARQFRQQAKEAFDAAWNILHDLSERYPIVPAYRSDLSGVYLNLGQLLVRMEQPGQAREAFHWAGTLREDVVKLAGPVPAYRRDLARAYRAQAYFDSSQDQPDQAADLYAKALAIQKELAAAYPAVPEYRNDLGNTLNGLARLRYQKHDLAGAQQYLEEALQLHRDLLRIEASNVNYAAALGNDLRLLAAVRLDEGKYADAAALADQLADVFSPKQREARREECVRAAEILARCVGLLGKAADLPEARRAELAGEYGGRAVAFLREAIQLGFQDAGELKRVHYYDPIRDRADFRKLLEELRANGKAPPGKADPALKTTS
jgi:tetratricopeptide (TPR) repeat protein/predicted Ser/Thr protein kinase